MVSQPDTSTSLALRGPSSVVSRPTLSRSKRYNRSHAGGTSYVPQNEFPIFTQSGDVEIVIRVADHQNRYLLHRHTLTRCSGFFEASTSQEWSRAQALLEPATNTDSQAPCSSHDEQRNASASPRQRWRYELDSGVDNGDVPMLVQKYNKQPASLFGPGFNGPVANPATASAAGSRSTKAPSHSHSSSAHSSHSFFRSVANLSLIPNTPSSQASNLSQADNDLLRDYDNLFRIFYNYPPVLDGVNIADAYVQCKTLLTLADQYDSLAVVGPRIDHHLLQFQSRLWKQIAKYPISSLRIGYLAHSRIIFQEALIHVVGQWPAGERSLRAALPDVVLDVIEDKVDELEETINRVESRLFRLGLTTSRGERVTPATSYLDWLAISLFRQWLADNTSAPPPDFHPQTSRSGRYGEIQVRNGQNPMSPFAAMGRAYRTLGATASAAFLGHEECKRFLKLSPDLYSRDNLRRFERKIDELKAMARELVRPLMGSCLELDLAGGSRTADSITYLTCTTVGDRDLPWHFT